jgi:DNA-binding CsgD family transcriptional regulator/PAS domain-containing protein
MQEFISAEKFSMLVGLIYDCAIDADLWPVAMEAIRRELNFHNATLDLMRLPTGDLLAHVNCNIPAEYLAIIPDAGADVIDQWGGAAVVQALPLDRPAVLTQVNPAFDADTSTNPYFVAFARPQAIVDVMAIGLARDAAAIGTVSFGRHERAGPIGRREVAVAQMLIPHLQRAATINRLLDGAVSRQSRFAATLDTLAIPVLLVDAAMRIVHANAAAQALLAQERLLRRIDGCLQAGTPGATHALCAAVTQAVEDESALGQRGLGIPVLDEGVALGALHVLPLREGRGAAGPGTGPLAAVFVAHRDMPFVAPTSMAEALFELTPAEARVFELVVTGHSQSQAAAMLGIKPSTLKTHLKRLYDKTGVQRQAELVLLAATLRLPL